MQEERISYDTLLVDCINRECQIVEAELKFDTAIDFQEYYRIHPRWCTEYAFKTKEQYLEWKNYCLSHYNDYSPRKETRVNLAEWFSNFSFSYGFACAFDYKELFETNNNVIKVDLPNKDNIPLWLEKCGLYWVAKSTNSIYTSHVRTITGEDPYDIVAIDFPGGPIIKVGDVLDNKYLITDLIKSYKSTEIKIFLSNIEDK